jgi:adenosylcobinamide kinase/adenosylcobinamide-phosphate guanylyltransferase
MKRLTLVLGGARSGKSTYAEQLAMEAGGAVLFVGTAEAGDEEMAARIARHRVERPQTWTTLEATANAGPAIQQAEPSGVVLLDCLTVLVANVLLQHSEDDEPAPEAEEAILAETETLLAAYRAGDAAWIIVSNEVGLGLVPPYPLGRVYRDALGRANQMIAAEADDVILLVAGLPWRLTSP